MFKFMLKIITLQFETDFLLLLLLVSFLNMQMQSIYTHTHQGETLKYCTRRWREYKQLIKCTKLIVTHIDIFFLWNSVYACWRYINGEKIKNGDKYIKSEFQMHFLYMYYTAFCRWFFFF